MSSLMKYYSLECSVVLVPGALSVGILCVSALAPKVLQVQRYQGYYSPGESGVPLVWDVRSVRRIISQGFHWLGASFSVHSPTGGLQAIWMM